MGACAQGGSLKRNGIGQSLEETGPYHTNTDVGELKTASIGSAIFGKDHDADRPHHNP